MQSLCAIGFYSKRKFRSAFHFVGRSKIFLFYIDGIYRPKTKIQIPITRR